MKKHPAIEENSMISILKEERERSERVLRAFVSELENLPKGSLQKKTRGNCEYFYLAYRNSCGAVKYDYVKKEDLSSVEKALVRRKSLEKSVRSLYLGIELLNKTFKKYNA